MAVKKIVYLGNEILRKKSEKIPKISNKIKELISDMFETLKSAKGLGLAGPQIGVSKAISVIDLTDTEVGKKFVLINPVIKKKYGKIVPFEEGCLSVPKIYANVNRASIIDVEFMDENGKKINLKKVDGLTARVFQHEIDHLNGIIFIDKISQKDKDKFKTELENIQKMSKTGVVL
jgi:peptide deformylase